MFYPPIGTSQRQGSTLATGRTTQSLKPLAIGLLGLMLATVTTSCSSDSVPSPVQALISRIQAPLNEVSLEIQVAPASEPGRFDLAGTANLPDGTRLTIMAIRFLHLQQPPRQGEALRSTYSILAYETLITQGDRWQTQLALWRTDPDGEYKEIWQLQQPELGLAVDPDEDVIFLATLSPQDDLEAIERELAADNQRLASRFIQTTSEGSRYLQTNQVLAVDLPTGQGIPETARPEDINGGWGKRYQQLPDPPNPLKFEFPAQRQTNAPLSSEELLY